MNNLINFIFFDIGGTLAEPIFTPSGNLESLRPMPRVLEVLQRLTAEGLRLGVISNTGDIEPAKVRGALEAAKLLNYFDNELVLLSGELGINKSSPAIFLLAAERADRALNPAACLYVGDDRAERRTARIAKMRTASSVLRLIDGLPMSFTKIPDLSNLSACVEDARAAGLDGSLGPAEPNNYHQLLGRLEAARSQLPPVYRDGFVDPVLSWLRHSGEQTFNQLLASDPKRSGSAGLFLDMVQAVLQNGEGFETVATDAFEEVVSDLYDGFLSGQDRSSIGLPQNTVLAPLVKWGKPDFGPYTWPIDATSSFNASAGVVSLPPANAKAGLFAWTALGHEAAGHDILNADDGLRAEISQAVRTALNKANLGGGLADYWADRIDETASDVFGILNMGPAAGIGLVVYFRGLNGAFTGNPRLRNSGPEGDPHPADILRGYLASSTVRLLSFDGAGSWGDAIERETDKDVSQIFVGNVPIPLSRAKQACAIVAQTIALGRMARLNQRSAIEIQNWRNEDESTVQELRTSIVTNTPITGGRETGVYAAHAVAAAALAALSGAAPISSIFQRMISVLKRMHDGNPTWGPLFVSHPGNIARDFTYIRTTQESYRSDEIPTRTDNTEPKPEAIVRSRNPRRLSVGIRSK